MQSLGPSLRGKRSLTLLDHGRAQLPCMGDDGTSHFGPGAGDRLNVSGRQPGP